MLPKHTENRIQIPEIRKKIHAEKKKTKFQKEFRVAKKCTKIDANVPKMHLFRKPRNGRVEAEKFRLGKLFQRLRQKNEKTSTQGVTQTH